MLNVSSTVHQEEHSMILRTVDPFVRWILLQREADEVLWGIHTNQTNEAITAS